MSGSPDTKTASLSGRLFPFSVRAEEGSRTLKVLLPHGPEPCASANSATSAFPFLPFFSLGTYYFTHFFQNVKLFSFFFIFFASTSTRKFIRLQQVPFLLRADPQGTFLYKGPLCPEYEKTCSLLETGFGNRFLCQCRRRDLNPHGIATTRT